MPLLLDRHRPAGGTPELRARLGWFVGAVTIAFLVLVGRLWQLQVIRGDRYFQASTDNFVKERFLSPVRGRILDRNGVVLVDNRPAFNVYVTPRYYSRSAHERLARILGLSPQDAESLWSSIEARRGAERYRAMLVREDVDRDRLALIEQLRSELPGVDVEDVPHRYYPHGTLAAHVLGYMNQITEAELARWKGEGYEPGDSVGRYGVEKQWEHYLRGKKGSERYVVDAKGQRKGEREAEALIAGPRWVPPVPGHNVVLTLDAELQRIAERALRHHPSGGVAVVEVSTGKIRALVSKPAFDPNAMTSGISRVELTQMEADPKKPFLDKTLRQHYYPGSTYKFVTLLAAIEDGLVTPEERVFCRGWHELGGRKFRCTKAHGSVSYYEAMAQSCNVYFWQLAERVGMDRISRVARDFGFGAPTGIGLNGDVAGRVPWKAWYERTGGFRIGYTLNTAIGQGDTEVTVLQLALAYAALANGGRLWVPQLVERVETASGKVVAEYPPTLRRRVQVSSRALAMVQRGLWGAVNDPNGTAFKARVDGLEVAGKTGTAQVRKLQKFEDGGDWNPHRDHAWFAGYAPAHAPEIAVVVLVEHGGHGGRVAAPVAMEIFEGWRNLVHGGVARAAKEGEGTGTEPGAEMGTEASAASRNESASPEGVPESGEDILFEVREDGEVVPANVAPPAEAR